MIRVLWTDDDDRQGPHVGVEENTVTIRTAESSLELTKDQAMRLVEALRRSLIVHAFLQRHLRAG